MLMLAMMSSAVEKDPPLSGHYRNCLRNSTLGGGVGGTPRSTVFSFKSQRQLWPQTCTFKFNLKYSAASLPVSLIHLYVKNGLPCWILFIMQTSKGSKKSAFSNMWTPLSLTLSIQTKAALLQGSVSLLMGQYSMCFLNILVQNGERGSSSVTANVDSELAKQTWHEAQ